MQKRLLTIACLIALSGLTACGGGVDDTTTDEEVQTGGKGDLTTMTFQSKLDDCQGILDASRDAAENTSDFMQANFAAADCRKALIDETIPEIEARLEGSDYAGQAAEAIRKLRITFTDTCELALDAGETSDGSLRDVAGSACLANNEAHLANLVDSSLLQGASPFAFDEKYPACNAVYSIAVEEANGQQDYLQASFNLVDCVGDAVLANQELWLETALLNFPGEKEELRAKIDLVNTKFAFSADPFCGMAAEAAGGEDSDLGQLDRTTCEADLFFVIDQILLSNMTTHDSTDHTAE